jgi:NitT/TauT family transport system substrate-binding protein
LEKKTLTLAVGGTAADLDKLGYAIALNKGFFKEEGIDLNSIDMFSGTKALQALVGGSVDVVQGSYENTIKVQQQGVILTCLGTFTRLPGLVLVKTKRGEATIHSLADLKGKNIGISAPGSSTHTFAASILQQAGLSTKDASFISVGIGASAMAAVVSGGELDALINPDLTITQLTKTGQATIMVDGRTEAGTLTAYGGLYPAGCVFVPEKFIKDNPNTSQAIANAIVHALKWLQTASVDDIVKAIPKSYYHDVEAYREALKNNLDLYHWDGIVTADMARTVFKANAILDPRLKNAKIDFVKTYDNGFTRRAWEKFK